jgi:penicillin-binding protein 1A
VAKQLNRRTAQGRRTRRVRRRKKKHGLPLWGRILLWGVGVCALCVMAVGALILAVYSGWFGPLPTEAQLQEIKNPQASVVYSCDGKLIGRYYIENRSNVAFEDISANVINALIATEDVRFYEHHGIDEVALMRVFFKTLLLQKRQAGGGSTISQQIAKNIFPREQWWGLSTPVNKIREGFIAMRLERVYTKNEILTLYLNTVPFGENIFGIEVAAERFFSKKPKFLTVDEAAVLVGMLKANNSYNPRLFPDRSRERRNTVLDLMVENNSITREEAETLKAKPLKIRYRRISYNEGPAPYFLEAIRPQLLEWCSSHTKPDGKPYNLFTDGLEITTTLDSECQQYAQEAVSAHMKKLQGTFDDHWKGSTPWAKNKDILNRAVRNSDRYKALEKAGKSRKDILATFNDTIETGIFSWEGINTVRTTPMDSLKHYLKMLNAGFMAMEPATGNVKAWVGGIDFRIFKYDHVTAARQVGSTFKPVVYLAALENGVSPFDYYRNERIVYEEYNNWSPRNANEVYEGYYSMEGALSRSVNTIAVQILMKTGINNVVATAQHLGIKEPLPAVPSLALGAASITPVDMTTAYCTIVNGGKRVEPRYIVSIANSDGKILTRFSQSSMTATPLTAENCRILMHMLQAVVRGGTGHAIRSTYKIPGDFAGKTGTTQDNSDGWFMGINPALVTGCWVGADDPGIHFRTTKLGQGSYMALPITGIFFSKLYRSPRFSVLQNEAFIPPSSTVLAELRNMPVYKDNDGQRFNDDGQQFYDEAIPYTPARADRTWAWERFKDMFQNRGN